MEILITIIIAIVALSIGASATLVAQKKMARTRAKQIVSDAEKEAENLKTQKLLEAKEEEMRITSEAEKLANQRLSKVHRQPSANIVLTGPHRIKPRGAQ